MNSKKVHEIVRLDKVSATSYLETVVFEEDMDTGYVAQIGELLSDGEGRAGAAPADLKSNLVFMAPVPMDYNDGMDESRFYLQAGKAYRGYVLAPGAIVTITDGVFDSKPAVGDVLVPKVGEFGYEVSDKDSALKFEVIADNEYLAGYPATVLRVI